MGYFSYHNNQLFVENLKVSDITQQYGTPCYIYSKAAIVDRYTAFSQAFSGYETKIFYAVKANSNIAILHLLSSLGSGFDIVSGGELARVLAAGARGNQIVFSGVGKSDLEIQQALEVGIACFNVESISELKRINEIAKRLHVRAPIALRINPNVNARSHPHITTGLKENKFGIDFDSAIDAYLLAKQCDNLQIMGVHCHIGSSLMDLEPYTLACDRILMLYKNLVNKGIALSFINMGGGLGIQYHQEIPPSIRDYANTLISKISTTNLPLYIEPGRAIVGPSGILASQVQFTKQTGDKHFCIVDAATNDLMRPAMYDAWQDVIPVNIREDILFEYYNVVGPICESSDCLAKDRKLAVAPYDLIAIKDSGAYGVSMSSNYNTRPRPPEILVDKDKAYVIRPRETIYDLFKTESIPS